MPTLSGLVKTALQQRPSVARQQGKRAVVVNVSVPDDIRSEAFTLPDGEPSLPANKVPAVLWTAIRSVLRKAGVDASGVQLRISGSYLLVKMTGPKGRAAGQAKHRDSAAGPRSRVTPGDPARKPKKQRKWLFRLVLVQSQGKTRAHVAFYDEEGEVVFKEDLGEGCAAYLMSFWAVGMDAEGHRRKDGLLHGKEAGDPNVSWVLEITCVLCAFSGVRCMAHMGCLISI